MNAHDVCDLLQLMTDEGIHIWLDGGWAVDACLGSETRHHGDLDIVIERSDVPAAVASLQRRGYGPVPRQDTRAWNFVLGDDAGHLVDFHVIVLDEQRRGLYGPPENGDLYPAEALRGRGSINGRSVDCIAPEWLVRFHTGYEIDETDRADVGALCARFGIPLPLEYRR